MPTFECCSFDVCGMLPFIIQNFVTCVLYMLITWYSKFFYQCSEFMPTKFQGQIKGQIRWRYLYKNSFNCELHKILEKKMIDRKFYLICFVLD